MRRALIMPSRSNSAGQHVLRVSCDDLMLPSTFATSKSSSRTPDPGIFQGSMTNSLLLWETAATAAEITHCICVPPSSQPETDGFGGCFWLPTLPHSGLAGKGWIALAMVAVFCSPISVPTYMFLSARHLWCQGRLKVYMKAIALPLPRECCQDFGLSL